MPQHSSNLLNCAFDLCFLRNWPESSVGVVVPGPIDVVGKSNVEWIIELCLFFGVLFLNVHEPLCLRVTTYFVSATPIRTKVLNN